MCTQVCVGGHGINTAASWRRFPSAEAIANILGHRICKHFQLLLETIGCASARIFAQSRQGLHGLEELVSLVTHGFVGVVGCQHSDCIVQLLECTGVGGLRLANALDNPSQLRAQPTNKYVVLRKVVYYPFGPWKETRVWRVWMDRHIKWHHFGLCICPKKCFIFPCHAKWRMNVLRNTDRIGWVSHD